MDPKGAVTLMGRNEPWFDGTLISEVSLCVILYH